MAKTEYQRGYVDGFMAGTEDELACVRAGGHDDVGLLPNTETGSSTHWVALLPPDSTRQKRGTDAS